MIYAKDFKCRKKGCEEQAVIFIESTDIDIELRIPFCRKHADDYNLRMMMVMYGDLVPEDMNKWLNTKDRKPKKT